MVWVHLKLWQRIKGLPTLVKGLLSSNEHFKDWQPLQPFEMHPYFLIFFTIAGKIQAFITSMFIFNSFFKRHFMQFVLCHQLFMNAIKYTIYKMTTLWCAVTFCKVNIFVNGNFCGNGFKI